MRKFENVTTENGTETVVTTAVVTATAEKAPIDFSTEKGKEYRKLENAIQVELAKTESTFLKIGFLLYQLNDKQLYEVGGFKNIYDMSNKKFNIARGTTNNFINIVEKFGERDSLGNITGKIKEKYKNFNSSKLIVMLGFDDELLEVATEEMTVRELKGLKVEYLEGKTAGTETDEETEEVESSDVSSKNEKDEDTRIKVMIEEVDLSYIINLIKIDNNSTFSPLLKMLQAKYNSATK